MLEDIHKKFDKLEPEEQVRQTLVESLQQHLDLQLLDILVEDQYRDIVIRRRQDEQDIFVVECKSIKYFIYRNRDFYKQLRGYLQKRRPPYHGALFNLKELVLLSHKDKEQHPLGRMLNNIEGLIKAINDAANEETVPINNARRR